MARATSTSYVVVCRGPHCREKGGRPLRQRLARLLAPERSTRLVGYACFGQCDFGPNVVFYPEGVFYGGLTAPEAAEQVVQHALGAEPLERPPLAVPDGDREEHLRNIGELIALLERDRATPRRWWWPF